MTSDKMLRMLADNGLRITEQRKTLVDIFVETDGYLTAKDIYEKMRSHYSGLSFDTVYRNLRIMLEMNVIEQFVFEDGLKFKVSCSEQVHHHHLICMECERTVPITFCPMEQVQAMPRTFKVIKHKFEVFGYCEACQ